MIIKHLLRCLQIIKPSKPKALIIFTVICFISNAAFSSYGLAIDQKSAAPNQALQIISQTDQNNVEQTATTRTPSTTTQVAVAPTATSTNEPAISIKARADLRRPIWSLAHMVNSIKELDYRLQRGANAVEVDVTFGRDGDPLYTYHGPPCDCLRHCYQQEDFNEYLSYVREIAIDTPTGIGQNLSILFLDLKLDPLDPYTRGLAGNALAKSLVSHLFLDSQASKEEILKNSTDFYGNHLKETLASAITNDLPKPKLPSLHLIISINHVQDIDLINNFINYLEVHNSSHLMQRIGFDVGMNDDLKLIEEMWRKFGLNLNLWQGDGYTNCLSPFYNLERLTKAIQKRDQLDGYPAKVYHWTIDLHERMRESLRLGVDAIMTNHPERVLNVLQEPDLAHQFRLANRLDDPFKKLTRDLIGRSSGETARYERSASATSGGYLSNLIDVLTSWYTYVREIPFLSLPVTMFSSSSSSYKHRARQANANNQTNSEALVKLQNQSPEYQLTADSIRMIQDLQSSAGKPIYGVGQQATLSTDAYEGPKWYTTLASNTLVSMMKLFLPS